MLFIVTQLLVHQRSSLKLINIPPKLGFNFLAVRHQHIALQMHCVKLRVLVAVTLEYHQAVVLPHLLLLEQFVNFDVERAVKLGVSVHNIQECV